MKIFSVRFQICGMVMWHLNTSFVPSLGNLLLLTFELDCTKNRVHLNLTVQSTGSPPPPNNSSAATKQFTALGIVFFSFCFFLDFIPVFFNRYKITGVRNVHFKSLCCF